MVASDQSHPGGGALTTDHYLVCPLEDVKR